MEVSAVVIAKKEEKKLPECLKSLEWADEVVLVDTTNLKGGFAGWRNEGMKRAKGKWVLYVDSDERVPSELVLEIKEAIKRNEFIAYARPRRNFVFGRELRHGGCWPDYNIRLFKKSNLVGWKGELHEDPVFEGKVGYLKNPVIHIKEGNLSEMVDKTNKWSEIEARLMFEAHHPPMNIFRFFSAGFREFWLRMIRQLAFLDGTEGIIYALYQVYSRLISYAKLWELQITKK